MEKRLTKFTAAALALATVALSSTVLADNHIADEKIAVAKASLDRAEQAGAPQLAPVELATARDKLARAQKANADHDRKPAAMLADQANIDAQVAEATAVEQHSKKAAQEFDASMQALRQEAARTSQSAQ